jgi:hypothetical protein
MDFLKMVHLTLYTILHLKVIFCQIFNSPHTYGHRTEKNPFVI